MSLTMLILYVIASFLTLRSLVTMMTQHRNQTLEKLIAEHNAAQRRKAQAEELSQAAEGKKKAGSAA